MATAPTVVFDRRPALGVAGGVGTYCRELERALAQLPGGPRVVGLELRLAGGGLWHAPRAWGLRLGVPVERLVGGAETADVVHATDLVPIPTRLPLVATIHDTFPFDRAADFPRPLQRRLARHLATLLRTAAWLIVPHEAVREALIERHGADPTRTVAIPHGVPALPETEPAAWGSPYMVMVGTIEPRKNHLRLLAAFRRSRFRSAGGRLVVVGRLGWLADAVVSSIASDAAVVWERAAAPERLAALYRGAVASLYPSVAEGFGLPVLEALSLGLPVLVHEGGIPHAVAGSAAWAVDACDVDALIGGIDGLAFDREAVAQRAAAARSRAATFTWRAAAERTLAVYEQARGRRQ